MSGDIGERTKSSLFWHLSLPGVYQVARFGISIIIARLLDPKDFGIQSIASAIVFYANTLTNFGFAAALVQKESISEDHMSSIFTMNLVISITFSLVAFIFARDLANFFNTPELKNVLRAISAVFLITTFDVIPLNLLRREVKYKIISLIEFIRGFCQIGVTLTMAALGFQYWSLVYGLIAGHLLGTILVNYQAKWIPKIRYHHSSVKEVLNFSWWNFLLSQSASLNNNLDTFIVGKFLGTVSLGYYDKAFSLANMPFQTISLKISDVMFTSFSRNQADKDRLKNHFLKLVSFTSLIIFPVFLGLVAIAPYFVLILFGDKWKPMIISFQVLSLSFIFHSIVNIIGSINLGAGDYKAYIIRRLYGILFILIMLLLFVDKGINVVSLVILIESIFITILGFNVTKQCVSVTWLSFSRAIKPALTGSVIMFMIVKLLSMILIEMTIINLFFLISVGIIAYTMWLLLIDFKEIRFLKVELKNRMVKEKKMATPSHN